jgi:AraC-like DNA-binding protein
MRYVRALAEAVDQAGVPRLEFLRAGQIDSGQVSAPEARLSKSELHRLYELALDLTKDPALGLRWAVGSTGHAFTPVSHLIAHSSSLRKALDGLLHFEPLLRDESSYRLFEDEARLTVRSTGVADDLRIRRFCAETTVTSFLRLVRYFDPHARPERVSFDYAAPPYREEYTRIFEGAERYEEPHTEIVFDRALLDVPSPNGDDDVHGALRTIAERRMNRLEERAPYALRVRDFLLRQASPRRIQMDAVAHSLGISARSLRRRLASEGSSYKAVESEALALLATHLLCEKQRTIQETAYEMGFSDTSTFHRAFKSWTGTTPSAYREKR